MKVNRLTEYKLKPKTVSSKYTEKQPESSWGQSGGWSKH